MKIVLKTLLILIILGISTVLGTFVWFNRAVDTYNKNTVEFEIVPGDNTYTVANRLYRNSLIRSRELFIIMVRGLKLHNKLKPGWVELSNGKTTIEVMKQLFAGNFITVSFTVPEGASVKQIRNILVQKNIISAEKIDTFLGQTNYPEKIGLNGYASAEGFLFPETYKFYKGADAPTILKGMVDLTMNKIAEIYPKYKDLSNGDLYQKVIMASIIEKEVRRREESRRVAGVFYNRLKTGMKLQSCATIQYVLGKTKEQLLVSDVLIEHPYNTYINKGLPPSPIGNPGTAALEAAFYPEKHDYLFFVVKDPSKGSHHFSVTYEEHLEAQKRYKKIKGFF